MFGQAAFGHLVFAQVFDEDGTVFHPWKIQCKTDSTWFEIRKDEVGIEPCNNEG